MLDRGLIFIYPARSLIFPCDYLASVSMAQGHLSNISKRICSPKTHFLSHFSATPWNGKTF